MTSLLFKTVCNYDVKFYQEYYEVDLIAFTFENTKLSIEVKKGNKTLTRSMAYSNFDKYQTNEKFLSNQLELGLGNEVKLTVNKIKEDNND